MKKRVDSEGDVEINHETVEQKTNYERIEKENPRHYFKKI